MKKDTETNPVKPVNQNADAAKGCNSITRAKARRKIDASIVSKMVEAVATMLTESEAARLCGIEPRHWFEWKSRAGRAGKFAAQLEAMRAKKIAGLLDRVQKSADGIGTKFPDFRAALALLKFQDLKRFGDAPVAAQVFNDNRMVISEESLSKAMRIFEKERKAIEALTAPKQLSAPSNESQVAPEREKP